ncbi:MAG: hypothetical protein V2I97_04875 [Desulfococcaceae bacterium]|nr:hypothetical protein [Desulfococcaceae bacterium]
MQIQNIQITREQVIALAKIMPIEKLTSWYEYGLFIQFRTQNNFSDKIFQNDQAELMKEIAEWEAASDEDALLFEHMIKENS